MTSAPRWARELVTRAADPSRVDEAVGDLDEAHRLRVTRHGRILAALLTSLEALDMARALRAGSSRRVAKVRRRGLPISWLDFKLGVRMLVRYPVLTLVAGFAMAFTVWVGAGTFEAVTQVLRPKLPLEDGDRIVSLQLLARENAQIYRQAGRDFLIWRDGLRTVEDLGAFRSSFMNLVVDGDVGEPVIVDAITASGFDLARVPPLLGRYVVPSDEVDGAASIAILSYATWTTRFGADPGVLGRVVRLGQEPATVVGVMPDGFGFPFMQDVWTALRTSALQSERREDLPISVFGRLAPGATASDLEAELTLHARRMASEFPETHANLVAGVMPHGLAYLGIPPDEWSFVVFGALSFNLVPILLLLLIAANVALLMFARAATREAEITVRAALGAGRARIVGQLFVESLVLGALAAGAGLAAASAGLRWVFDTVGREAMGGEMSTSFRLPFWFHASLSPETIVYAGVLTLLGATLAGVLPGLKVTQGLGTRLRGSGAGGGGLKFGGVWTAVIIAQVAITMPVPALIMALDGERTKIEDASLPVPAEEYLAFRVEMEAGIDVPEVARAGYRFDRATLAERYAATIEELERRLEADPRVASVTTASRLPRMYHAWRPVEVLEDAAPPPADDARGHVASSAYVALDYFDALGAPLVSGRSFSSADRAPDARTVIVNASFVENVLGGRNAIGRHVRYRPRPGAETTTEEPWYQIVGVVPDLGTRSGAGPFGNHGIYHPLERSRYPIWVAAHVRGDPIGFAPEVRATAQSVDPTLEVHSLMPLAEVASTDVNFYDFWITLVIVVCVIAVVLSLAGVYAAMSFAVSRRTREIGIRVALGAGRGGIVISIFRRPLLQLGTGILLGTLLTSSIFAKDQDSPIVFVVSFVIAMAAVTSLACIVPTRRALGVEPSEALRSE